MSLENLHFDEAKQSQLPFIELLVNMGYKYISAEETLKQRGDESNFILREIAFKKLMEINQYEVDGQVFKFSEKDVAEAVDELRYFQFEGLINTSQKIYNTIMPTSGGKTIKVNHGGKSVSKDFRFIDFKNPMNNDFHVTAEFKASGRQNIRPDIVCFVNGIPFAIIENKKSSVSVQEALTQLNRYQGNEYCPKLFCYAQLLVGSNGKELQYGTTGTQNKFFSVWKEKGITEEEFDEKVLRIMIKQISDEDYSKILKDLNGYTRDYVQKTSRAITAQDRGVVALFEPKRLLDLTKNFILFDGGVKKISRYQQYFAISKMVKRISEFEELSNGNRRRKGGLVWHTQGSGKSLTMVMFVKALIENPDIKNPRVLIVTDRRDLDKQIKETFVNCNLKKEVVKATSGRNLLDLIKSKDLRVITTLIHKFDSAGKKRTGFVDNDENIFVLIDEAHRSQNGFANLEMNRIIPNACFIGFTGTPLMKKEKASWVKFGGYIDKYTIDDALEDKVVLPLIYEGRYVPLEQNKEQVDRYVNRVLEDLNDVQRNYLMKEVSKKEIKNNPNKITEIAFDIEKHYIENFQHTGLKAQIVAPSKFSAVLFQRIFEQRAKVRTAVVISDENEKGDPDAEKVKGEVIRYLKKVKDDFGSVEKHEEDVVNSFKYNEDGIEIIIVVSKLLTGFDAPRNTVLYLADNLKDHSLLQAIARVNRLFENKKERPKTAGYIIDYSENAKNISSAMKLFGNYDEADIGSALIDVGAKIQELEQSYGELHDIFKTVKTSNDDEVYLRLLDDEANRKMFYKKFSEFVKNFDECFALQDFVHEFKHLDVYKGDLKKFAELRKTVSVLDKDRVDLEEHKQSLIRILDKYVDAKGVELMTEPVVISDIEAFDKVLEGLGSDKSKAEAIASQMQKTIMEKVETDPEFYGRFSDRVSDILEQMKQAKIEDIEALKQLQLFREEMLNKKEDDLPGKLEGKAGESLFYRNLKGEFEKLAMNEEMIILVVVELFEIVKRRAIVDWDKNSDVKRMIRNALDDYLYDNLKVDKGIDIDNECIKLVIDIVMKLSENNVKLFR